MPRTIKTIVKLKPKSATAGFETGTASMQKSIVIRNLNDSAVVTGTRTKSIEGMFASARASFQLFKKGRVSPKRGRVPRPAKTA